MVGRQGRRVRAGLSLTTIGALAWVACAAPISTIRSPYHLRVVEVHNATDQAHTLKIEPTAEQHLGGTPTTFTGILKPGEVKVLYVYHGFEYAFRILDEHGFKEVTRTTVAVTRDIEVEFAGDSLWSGVRLVAELGEPKVTFADSLQAVDPFGLRRTPSLEPDTTRGRRPETELRGRQADEVRQ